ncbi:Symplekin [Sarcoptes scabiei]|uniref:Symplekin n=1 Tax=Sarcoptes scabiei TaxID=52283 RepID=A0A834VE06_SARSC|nr:Symplekin [Sarcoptes scabiei]
MSEDQASNSIETKVIELLENAIVSTVESEKVSYLNQAQELVINHDILDNFLDEILGFQNDLFSEVRKFVSGFIECTCKKEPDYFPKLIINLCLMLSDQVPNVLKRVIQSFTQLYKIFLIWTSKAKCKDELESTWEAWNQIKNQVFSLIDLTENDGVRTQCVKFIETVIICQTKRDAYSKEEEFSLDSISSFTPKFIDIDSMEEEARQLFEQLINFQSKIHISSVNLMATMQSLSLIARQRSRLFYNKVVEAFETLSLNLPPTLTKSQVNSVNKQLKLHLIMLAKHQFMSFSKHQTNLAQAFGNIGVKQHEISRYLPETKKRPLKSDLDQSNELKRIKIEIDDDDDEMDNNNNNGNNDEHGSKLNLDSCLHDFSRKLSRYDAIKAADITAKDLINRLNDLNLVSELVISSLSQMPDDISSNDALFLQGFTFSFDHAVIAKKFAFYLTGIGLGPGFDEIQTKYIKMFENQYRIKLDEETQKRVISLVKKIIFKEMKNQQQSYSKVKLVQSGKMMTSSMRIKHLKLEDITKPLKREEKINQIEKCLSRILQSHKQGQMTSKQMENNRRIIGKLSSDFFEHEQLNHLIKKFIFHDLRSRYDILMNAVYLKYIEIKTNPNKNESSYSDYLLWIIRNIIENCELIDQDYFIQKFYLESPRLDQKLIDYFMTYVANSPESALNVLKLLIERRPSYRAQFLENLLKYSIETSDAVTHQKALKLIKEIYLNPTMKNKILIEKFSLDCLQKMKYIEKGTNQQQTKSFEDNEDRITILLSLYLLLLPINLKLLHELPSVYTESGSQTKRLILRLIQEPIEDIDMNSPELIVFVQNCSTGSETLVSRVIHILTEKQPPSLLLVQSVKNLYQKSVFDVRFLIPVLCGFSKLEIIEILPQLIKLNPTVVKEVFNRLLIAKDPNNKSTISPADLMISLHNIDTSKCNLKNIIKAIQLCFEEKTIFTAEVLAVVMQMLIEQSTLPTLLMRTIIQTLSHFPRLIGFIMNNIMQKLILKQVWNQRKVWEGFIKCCQRMIPHSFHVLLQLPSNQLVSVFENCPEIKPALMNYLQELNEQQLSLIPQSLLDVIMSTTSNDINQKNHPQQVEDHHQMENFELVG